MTEPAKPEAKPELDLRTIRLYAAEADVATETLQRALRGGKCQQSSIRRIREVLEKHGRLDLLSKHKQ